MALTKKQRQEVWDKSQGHCWYCGCKLPKNGWHADHFWPIYREVKYVPDNSDSQFSHKSVNTGECWRKEYDTLENTVPSCAPCNLFKASYPFDFFRIEIEAQIKRVRKASSGFRIAERMGIIEPKPEMKVVFLV